MNKFKYLFHQSNIYDIVLDDYITNTFFITKPRH
jgi:hypothetical protein